MQGVLKHYFPPTVSGSPNPAKPVPVELLVTGSVPAGSGLSSSAAMVVASTLAFLAVNGKVSRLWCFRLALEGIALWCKIKL
jgi:galactokinase